MCETERNVIEMKCQSNTVRHILLLASEIEHDNKVENYIVTRLYYHVTVYLEQISVKANRFRYDVTADVSVVL